MWYMNPSSLQRANRSWPIRLVLLGLFLLGSYPAAPVSGRPDRAIPDPVDEFRKALKLEASDVLRVADAKSKSKQVQYALQFREKNLRGILAKMTSLGDLSRALLLQEWLQVDSKVREAMLERFKTELQEALRGPDPRVVSAAAALIAEVSNNARKQEPQQSDVRNLLTGLAPELIKLTDKPDPSVRAAAALALGQIQAPAKDVGPVLKKLLAAHNEPEVRRAASQALNDQIQFLVGLITTPGGSLTMAYEKPKSAPKDKDLPTIREEARDYSIAALDAFTSLPGAGLGDPDVEIRLQCTNTVGVIATGFRNQVPEGNPSIFPPEGRKADKADEKTILDHRKLVQQDFKFYRPLFEAFQKAAPALACVSLDDNPFIRRSARNVLEEIAGARRKMRNYLDSIPPVPKVEEDKDDKKERGLKPRREFPAQLVARRGAFDRSGSPAPQGFLVKNADEKDEKDANDDAFPRSNNPLLLEPPVTLDALIKGLLCSPDERSRILAVDAIETMGMQGEPAIPALLKALGDPSVFVRWATARTLGRLAPTAADVVVPALVAILCDPDIDVRVAAVTAIDHFGLLARGAIPALTQAVGPGDAELRIAAMKALVATGSEAASAAPQIAAGLTDTNVRIRRQAAQTLGRFGPLAAPTAPALRAALTDTDPDVRMDAADALIKVLGK
jgi:HEAT repeat protein